MGYLLFWKLYVSGALAVLFIPAMLIRRSSRNTLLGITGILYCIADILINPVPLFGIALFGVGHLLLLMNMLRYPFSLKRFWIFISICVVFLIAAHFISTSVEVVAPFALPCVIYGILLVAAVMKTAADSKLLLCAMLVFLASDIMLIFNFTMDTSRAVKITGLVVYYISVAMMMVSMYVGPREYKPLIKRR